MQSAESVDGTVVVMLCVGGGYAAFLAESLWLSGRSIENLEAKPRRRSRKN